MKARYKWEGTKNITVGGETLSFPSGEWIVLPTIAFLNKIKSHSKLFDVIHEFNIKPYLKYGNTIRFGAKTIETAHKPTIRALSKLKSLEKQAELPEKGIVIFRLTNLSDIYLDGFVSLKQQTTVLCKRHKGGIGDIIMTTPAIEAIKQKYPHYVIDYACPKQYVSLLENNPFIRDVYDVKIVNESKYEIVYDMTRKCIQHEGRTQPDVDKNRTEIFADVVDIQPENLPRTKFYLSQQEVHLGQYIDFESSAKHELLVKRRTPSNDKLVIGVCVNSSAKVRSYYYADELVKKISEEYPEAIILFFQEKQEYLFRYDNVFHITGFSLRDCAVLISRCDFFFGPDTGLTHIAAALRVQTLWFFSHVDGNIRTRGYDTSEIVQETPPSCPQSAPCWYLFPCDPAAGEHLDSPPCVISTLPNVIVNRMRAILSFPCVSIIVLCHNRFEITKECIERLLNTKKYNDELILIDNGSSDETQDHFSNLGAPNFYYYRLDENSGCVSGRNIALKQCQGLFAWILDNDQFIEPHSMQRIIETEGDLVGVEGWWIGDDGMATKYSKCGMLNYVGAGGLFAKLNVLQSIDFFDENYNPAWFEDPDLCFKATQAGYSLGLCETSEIEHLAHSTNHSQTTFNSPKTWIRNRKYFVEKWKHLQKGKPIVSIVILTHNDSDTTIRCIESVYRNTDVKHFEVIVVENGSKKAEVEKLIHYEKPGVKYVFNHDNLMVAAGRNVGAEAANGEFILFLDNDMLVPEGWLPELLDRIDRENAVAISPKVVDLREGRERVRFIGTKIVDGRIAEMQTDEIYDCDFLPGGAMMVRRSVFNKFPFDEKFVFGVEDYDWCMRVKKDDYKLVNNPSVTFVHAKTTKDRTVTPYDDAERRRKGSSYIEDSIRLFLYRYQNQLPNQWKESGWMQWAIGKQNEANVMSLGELLVLIHEEIAKLYPDEIREERFHIDENIGVELGRRG